MSTLFLDRDGVLNIENPGGYITDMAHFKLYNGVREAVARLRLFFDRVLVVTNQRCVGKGLIAATELEAMHAYMNKLLDGAIDKIYYASSIHTDHEDRKPNIGMGRKAKRDFPEIDFDASVMVGNNLSDMEFGRRLGMKTVLLNTTQAPFALPHSLIDGQYDNLLAFSNTFTKKTK